MVRTEVRQLRESEYLIAAKCMGGSFWHILRVHLLPNFVSSIMFMIVMNIRSAIIAESTLSFLGIGLPMEIISWGSMLSLSEKALMTNSWWIILIPGMFACGYTALYYRTWRNFAEKCESERRKFIRNSYRKV